jgi:ribose transport system permease protein
MDEVKQAQDDVSIISLADHPSDSGSRLSQFKLSRYGTIMGLFVLIGIFSAFKGSTFFTTANGLTILDQASLLGVVAGGLTICLVLNEFDLSIGYSATLGGVVATQWLNKPFNIGEAILVALIAGLLVGFINGILVAYGRVNAFIATLGTGAIVYGIILAITGGTAVQVSNLSFDTFGQEKLWSIPIPVIISAVILAILWFFLNRTEPGRRIDAVGGNPEAARLSGVRVGRSRMLAFMISGVCAAAAGVVLASQLGAGYSDAGSTYLLQAFTACFLGAVTLREGEFHIVGTAVGVVIMGVAFNGLAQLGVATYWQNIAQGGILIIAVGISTVSGRISLKRMFRRPARL